MQWQAAIRAADAAADDYESLDDRTGCHRAGVLRGQAFQKKLFANGLNLKTTGDCAIIAPPLIAERSHVDLIGDILRKTLKAL